MYVYICGWNSPGCLPDNPPSAFDNELAARNYMRDIFRNWAAESWGGKTAAEFDKMADDIEFYGDAAMGNGDSYWDGPDGMTYFIECVDWTDDEWREYISGRD